MRRNFYQVTGRSALTVDHPATSDTKSYRPGAIFEESPLNPSVVRAMRTNGVRMLTAREAKSLRAMQQAKRAQIKKGPPPASVKTRAPVAAPTPIVILDDEAPKRGSE